MANLPFQVIPVLDLASGRAVHAKAGRREYYQPIRSILHPSTDPIELAGALRDTLGLRCLYLADLDAIAGLPPNLAVFKEIIALGIHLIVDPGIRDAGSAAPLLDLGAESCTVVAGLETVQGPQELAEIVDRAGPDHMIFSLDLVGRRPRIANPAAWAADQPRDLAREAIARGIRRLLLLDLSRVGTGRGPGVLDLMSSFRAENPRVGIGVGGGISRIDEVLALKCSGAAFVLVGSALHDGQIGVAELARLGT
jgi:phosphoribosylformimino-5-aminoimidazole carboxamide ribotide isomerase